jgi:hypothetical protein
MPRLSNPDFIKAHHRLKRYWEVAKGAPFSRLTTLEQWQLHDFFQPTKDLTDTELLTHRGAISQQRPALPSQAGKAPVRIDEAAASWAVAQARRLGIPVPKPATRKKGDTQTIKIYGIVNPELDLQSLVELLVDIARNDMTSTPEGVVEDRLYSINHQDPGDPAAPSAAA